jgi:hypothetical protein
MPTYQIACLLALALSSLPLLSCKPIHASEDAAVLADTQTMDALPALKTLTEEYFARNSIGISRDTFSARWKNSLESPLIFFRSHVRAYYAITKNIQLPDTSTGPCFGDAHVANFGFVDGKDNEARFLYNDLDDSGICPVLLDALRYFTSLRFLEKNELIAKELSLYSAILYGKEDLAKIKRRFEPNFKKIRSKIIARFSENGKLIRKPGVLEDVDSALAVQISNFASKYLAIENKNGTILDIVAASGRGGGSFGLPRYWVLINSNQEDIIELKETVEPATSFGGWGQIKGDRLETLKKFFWGGNVAARVYREGKFLHKTYVVRSRVKASVDPEAYDSADREAIYDAQVSLMAELHRRSLANLPEATANSLAEWLEKESRELARLYEKVFKRYK